MRPVFFKLTLWSDPQWWDVYVPFISFGTRHGTMEVEPRPVTARNTKLELGQSKGHALLSPYLG